MSFHVVALASSIVVADSDSGVYAAGGRGVCLLVTVGRIGDRGGADFAGNERHSVARLHLDYCAPVADGGLGSDVGWLVGGGRSDLV